MIRKKLIRFPIELSNRLNNHIRDRQAAEQARGIEPKDKTTLNGVVVAAVERYLEQRAGEQESQQ